MEDETNEGWPALLDGDGAGFGEARHPETLELTLMFWHRDDASSSPCRSVDEGHTTVSLGFIGEMP
jgi:hypothetical protein